MDTIKQNVRIPDDHKLRLDVPVPSHIPAGDAEVVVVISPVRSKRKRVDWDALAGCLADSPTFAGDPVALQWKLRDEWN